MNNLISEAKRLEDTLHAAWQPIAVRHQHDDPHVIRLAKAITRAHNRYLRRKHQANPNDPDALYANMWYEIYNKIPPWIR
jgi:hypothetical protein